MVLWKRRWVISSETILSVLRRFYPFSFWRSDDFISFETILSVEFLTLRRSDDGMLKARRNMNSIWRLRTVAWCYTNHFLSVRPPVSVCPSFSLLSPPPLVSFPSYSRRHQIRERDDLPEVEFGVTDDGDAISHGESVADGSRRRQLLLSLRYEVFLHGQSSQHGHTG